MKSQKFTDLLATGFHFGEKGPRGRVKFLSHVFWFMLLQTSWNTLPFQKKTIFDNYHD